MPPELNNPDGSPYLRATRIRVRHDAAEKMRQKCGWRLNGNAEWWNGNERCGGVLHHCELTQEHSSKYEIASASYGKKGGKKPEALICKIEMRDIQVSESIFANQQHQSNN